MADYGYERDDAPNIQSDGAVRWWYCASSRDGAFRFARGGRARTAREARKLIRGAAEQHDLELQAWSRRPTHLLLRDGSLAEIPDEARGKWRAARA